MPLAIGDKLGPYEIISPIGAGGMGEVFRARDTRLDRMVALKVSKQEFSERFEREARAVAALNHPHICQLYDVGPNYLVMEYVEGAELKGPMPLDKAVEYAGQILEALDAAHRKHITHRDLKPANILVTKQGIKLLDFGLAKQASPISSSVDTMTALTTKGEIAGTLQYMSPEQLQGKDVDARSDLFSFGCVLYEMLCGKRAFEGESAASVIAATLERQPAPLDLPSPLRRVIATCLAKDPDQRFQNALDLKRNLIWATEQQPKAPAKPRRWYWAALAVLAAAALGGWAVSRPGPTPTGAPESLVLSIVPQAGTRLTPVGSMMSTPLISPDGASVLYRSDDRRTHLRRLRSPEPEPLREAEAQSNQGFWSPDSRYFLFLIPQVLRKIRVSDGSSEDITPLSGFTSGGSSNEEGTIVVASSSHKRLSLLAVYAGRGEAKLVNLTELREGDYYYPQFLPEGRDLLFGFVPRGSDELEIYLAAWHDGKPSNAVLLLRNQTGVRYTPAGGGRILFIRDDKLYAQRLNIQKRTLVGEPELIQPGVGSLPSYRVAYFSVAQTGAIAWRPGRAAVSQITTFDRHGKPSGAAGSPGNVISVRLSPDETRLLGEGRDHTWLYEPDRTGSLSIGAENGFVWSPDGSHLIGVEGSKLISQAVNESAARFQELAALPGTSQVDDIASDGKHLLYRADGSVFSVALNGPPAERISQLVVKTGEVIYNARFSPDARWVVYRARTKQNQENGIYVQPVSGTGLRKQVSARGGFPVWRKDGKEILYLDQDRIWSVRVEATGTDLRLSAPEALFAVRSPGGLFAAASPLDVSRDGSRIYFAQAVEQPASDVIHVRIGWPGPQ